MKITFIIAIKEKKKHKKDSLMSLNFLFINSLYSFKHNYSTSDNFYLLQGHGYIYLQLPLYLRNKLSLLEYYEVVKYDRGHQIA